MQRRRSTPAGISTLRWALTCAIGAVAVGALVAVHVFLLPSAAQREIGYRRKANELGWTQEIAPPQLAKLRISTQKVSITISDSWFAKLWKPPSNRNFVPCVSPSSSFLPPSQTRGYLLVHANGGLNQMRAGVIKAAKSDSRLANNNLPPDIQKLRCRAFYEALRFAPRIEALGKLLVERMRSYGRYIALHLRYEKDMLAFSGCTYGLSSVESDELARIRENISYWKVKEIDPQEQRAKGYCPLTPKEVGIFLSSLGYPSNTPIYIAAGAIYGGGSHLSDLESRFPILLSKEKLASAEELEPFKDYASQMAALDYIVSVESDVFIPSYLGNMARAVEGHRRFLGHRKTINPNRKDLVQLFDKINRGSLKEGKKLSNIIVEIHKRRQGSPRKRKGPIPGTKGVERFRSEEAFYENPLPDCLCQQEQ
ncbi:hypothetical protein C4D60_Mb04t31460 [Musa balbisiana]|uniref:O-fucosyltransferase family protein n=1 Tax=Musa balbisiana TaxID=52838 RepID=A0A4S8KG06_MUSBA|nr:hypothetical protein C4D60_Mb04t31460 [Musa balbisiana]